MRKVKRTAALRLALALVILNQETKRLEPLQLNDEQREVLDALTKHKRVIVLKGRQVGISTVCLLYDLVYALINPGVTVAIVADDDTKAKKLLGIVTGWAKRILGRAGLRPSVANTEQLTLPNGSTIEALTARSPADGQEGESRVGRSGSYALIHCTEVAFWSNDVGVFAALTSASPDQIVIESTATPAENLFFKTWHDGPGWTHLFFSVERHAAYRRRVDELDERLLAKLQEAHGGLAGLMREYGFTSEQHAAWWWWKLHVDLAGDVHRALREFPIRQDQAFSYAEGRWIFRFHPPAKVRHTGLVDDDPVNAGWTYYVEPKDIDEPVVFGVDTATGKGLDASSIAVRGQRTRRLVASYKSSKIAVPLFAKEVVRAARTWKPAAIVVEDNGIGEAIRQLVALEDDDDASLVVTAFHSSDRDGEKWVRMHALKEEIEDGTVAAAAELQHEVKHSAIKRNPRTGKVIFTGPDDLLNALTFAGDWIAKNPFVRTPEQVDTRERLVVEELLRKRGGRARELY